ncbi:MAG: major capsid protein [Fimbriiglobus sp.]
MFTDFIQNGVGHGDTGEALQGVRFDPGMLRPYVDERGRKKVVINTGRLRYDKKVGRHVPIHKEVLVNEMRDAGYEVPVSNATSLRKLEWVHLDNVVVRATRQRLRAWADLSAASPLGGFNGMSKMTHEYEAMSDVGEAVVDMDGLTFGRADNPQYKLRSIPLPITHSDFWFSARRLAVSRNSGTPLDTTMAEMAGRRVAEMIERTLVGVETGVSYGTDTNFHDGTSKVYGYTNFPNRVTKTNLTTPTGANPEAVKNDVIAMRETMYSNGFYGPFMLYTSTGYDAFLDDDYFRTGSTAVSRTTRERVMEIDGVAGIRRLDYLTSGFQMILVQMTPDVAQAINAMDVTTVQWESQGGARMNFRVMAIQVPLLKAPFNGTAGIVHGTTS